MFSKFDVNRNFLRSILLEEKGHTPIVNWSRALLLTVRCVLALAGLNLAGVEAYATGVYILVV